MKSSLFRPVLLVLAVGLVTLACAALQGTPAVPGISNIRMATDDSGDTTTVSYSSDDDFYVFADLAGIEPGSLIEARWYAMDAQDLAPNTEINTSDYNYEAGITYVYFQLSTSDGGDWPIGTYRVELYLNGTKAGEASFAVR